MNFAKTTPILRSFDEAKAKEFYVGFLGFRVDWEHRFEPGLPLYMQVSRGGCVFHISEHHGDCSPGAAMRIEVDELDAFHQATKTSSRQTASCIDNGYTRRHNLCICCVCKIGEANA